jgi:hypothetical protein
LLSISGAVVMLAASDTSSLTCPLVTRPASTPRTPMRMPPNQRPLSQASSRFW